MKSIFLGADGTWNTAHTNSAIATKLNVCGCQRALLYEPAQLKYYACGATTDGTQVDQFPDGKIGGRLFLKTQNYYRPLSFANDPCDPIVLFGFSAGAFTAASVTGL